MSAHPNKKDPDHIPSMFESEKRIAMYAFELMEKAQEEKFRVLVSGRLILAEAINIIVWENEMIAQTKLKTLRLLSEEQDKLVERRMSKC